MGISPLLARNYKESGWIESIGFGAYKVPDSDLSIEGFLHCLQKDLLLNLHAGETVFLPGTFFFDFIHLFLYHSHLMKNKCLFSIRRFLSWNVRNQWKVKAISLFMS
jgi:hypothetical protein